MLPSWCALQKIPPGLLPGIQRWQALLEPCVGIFTTSKFSNLLDGFSRMLAPWTTYGIDQREATVAESLAQALGYLSLISRKKLESCTFSGGIDCAWLAATAEFMFGFTVDVMTPDGEYEYRSSHGQRTPNDQGQVIFLKAVGTRGSTQMTRTSYNLPSGRTLLHGDGSNAFGSPPDHATIEFDTRSPWTSILSDSFGVALHDLLRERVGRAFAMLLVYVARRTVIFEGADLVPKESEIYG